MKTSQRGLDMIKGFEGFKFTAYKCPAGVLTIGYGHTKDVKDNDVITRSEAEAFLIGDIQEAENAVKDLVKVHINQNKFDSLVSFTFNIGISAFSESTLLKMLVLLVASIISGLSSSIWACGSNPPIQTK